MSNPLIIIPARMAATRLPNKPLADICGQPMIVHVLKRAQEAQIGPVIVATDSREIAQAVERAGGIAIMTRADHPSGSDRIYEALERYDPNGKYDIIVNVQGDLPTLDPAIIQQALVPLQDATVDISTLVATITRPEEISASQVVKAIGTPLDTQAIGIARRYRALYFTRAIAPSGEGAYFHHIGLYGYRRAALQRFVSLAPTPLEMREKLEQLRALEHGMRIDFMLVDTVPHGVDTPEDLERARALLSL